MADGGRGAQGRAETFDTRRRAVVAWLPRGEIFPGAREVLWRWLVAEVAPGRLLPWLPIAFGCGIVLYFTADTEPNLPAAIALAAVCAAVVVLVRARPIAFPVLLGVAAIAAGFAIITLRTAQIAHPILRHNAWNIALSGFVEVQEEREKTDRIVVRVHRIEGRLNEVPERVRLSVRKGMAPPVGTFIEVKARLNPPLRPLRPGGYDFSRDLFFQQIGATGFVTGAIKILDPPAAPGHWLRYAAALAFMRDTIDARIRAAIPGDNGSIASALITGKRDAISTPVNDAMYISGLGHVLSISGYHMALVAGVVFFTVRALLALIPVLAMRYPVKKWAALGALIAALFYLLLSGSEVATQRSFIMTAIILTGVMVDRAALTMRNLALAALAVLVLLPEAVAHPSFQMSFAATLGLIAGYERGIPWMRAGADTPLGARIALWGGREIVALVVVSLAAGSATIPYVGFHFHRIGPYGALANLLAMPIVSAWVMPAGLLALLAMPFGFDAPLWRLMGLGEDWMIWVAKFVAGLPGAVGRVTAFGIGPVLLCTIGLLVLGLLRSPLRWCGACVIVAASLWAALTPVPDVYVSERGDLVAVRGASAKLSILRAPSSDAFALREWLAADADPRSVKDPSLREGATCDTIGCVARLVDGTIVALPFAAEAFEEDCSRAALVVSQRTAPPDCAATVIDRTVWPKSGTAALYRTAKGWETVAARPSGYDRPWARPPVAAAPTPTVATPRQAPPRDATPEPADLAPDD